MRKIVGLGILLVVASSCIKRPIVPSGYQLRVSDDMRQVSLTARRVPLSTILAELHDKYKVEVRLSEPGDSYVTASFENRSLDEAIRAIVPSRIRYALRIGDRELDAGPSASLRKRGNTYSALEKLPEKLKQAPVVPSAAAVRKLPVEQIALRTAATGPGLKAPASALLQVPRGEGPKRQKAPGEARQDRTLWMSFTLTAAGAIRLNTAALIEGQSQPSRVRLGQFLFGVRDRRGGLVHFGSFADPLEQDAVAEKDGPHTTRRVEEAAFTISVPAIAAITSGDYYIEFFDGRQGNLPDQLTEREFTRASGRAKRMNRIEGSAIQSYLKGGRQ